MGNLYLRFLLKKLKYKAVLSCKKNQNIQIFETLARIEMAWVVKHLDFSFFLTYMFFQDYHLPFSHTGLMISYNT